ncbi:MAG: RNA pseudouridine synthase [Candidatus Omnitrophota bacterium]
MNIPVVYEDEGLIVFNKPYGLLTIPSPNQKIRTLTSIVNAELSAKGIPYRLHPCHRLDKETSGLIIYAKGKSLQKKMMEEFKQGRVEKKYLAFVRGALPKDEGTIRNKISGQSAITGYSVLERKNGFTVVEARPLTGRTNQIRIHFKEIGHPLLGERKFAFGRDFDIKAKRLCLHAFFLKFTHPVTKKTLTLKCEPENKMADFLKEHSK